MAGYFAKTKKQDIFNDNGGSVMVMVLVAFMFVSILVAIVLSSTVVNFQMRSMDRQVKDEFYYAEKALDDIYAGVGLDTSQIMGMTYNKVLSGTGYLHGYSAEIELEAIRSFNEAFTNAVESAINNKSVLEDYIVKKSTGRNASVEWGGRFAYKYEDTGKALVETYTRDGLPKIKGLDGLPTADADYGKLRAVVLKDIKVSSKKSSDTFVSYITTDIVVRMPSIDFITVNSRGIDYAVVANDGIDFDGNVTIKGNVYAGGLTTGKITEVLASKPGSDQKVSSTEMGGINVNGSTVTLEGSYIVSGADININDSLSGSRHGKLIIDNHGAECEVWFENLNINTNTNDSVNKHEALNVNASLYALDDLVVNGENSRAVFKGSYYGYNDGSMSVKTKDYVTNISSGNTVVPMDKSSASSSIIVNAKNAEIDMRDVQTFVMLGKAYINHASKENNIYVSNKNTDIDLRNIPTNESVAAKSDQEMYLVPTEFLETTNPAIGADLEVDIFNDDTVTIPDQWFGYEFLKGAQPGDPTTDKPYTTVFVKNGSLDEAYCYLNFRDDESRLKYLAEIIPHAVNKNIVDAEKIVGPITDNTQNAFIQYQYRANTGRQGVDYNIKPTPTDMYERIKTLAKVQGSGIYIGDDGIVNASGVGIMPGNKAEDDTIHIYSPNGIVQNSVARVGSETGAAYNDQIVTMKMNNTGIERFANYKMNMYNKYKWLDTYLDTQENHALTNLMAVNTQNFNWTAYETAAADYDNDNLPLSRIIWVGTGAHPLTSAVGGIGFLPEGSSITDPDGSFGGQDLGKLIVSNGDYVLNSSLHGFLLADGNVTVKNGVNVSGFIYATGKVTFEGNNTIMLDSNLYQRRIEEEIKEVKQEYKDNKHSQSAYKNYYLISYLLSIRPIPGGSIWDRTDDPNPNDTSLGRNVLKYQYGSNDTDQTVVDYDIDYRDFVMYENWRKGTN